MLSYSYQLPFGKGKQFANQSRVANAIIGGWQVAGVQSYQSGTPLSVTSPNWDSGVFAGTLRRTLEPLRGPTLCRARASMDIMGGGWKWGEEPAFEPCSICARAELHVW